MAATSGGLGSDHPEWSPSAEIADADRARVPSGRQWRREWHTLLELTATATVAVRREFDRWPRGDGHPVLVLPGFLAGPQSTGFLRGFLRRQGYYAHDWKQGLNLGVRAGLQEAGERRLDQIAQRHGRAVSLIGWSAGGIYARELARGCPELTRGVITLGSPFRGNHRATHAWRLYALLNHGPSTRDLVSRAARLARAEPLPVPTTCVYSKSDGIVAWECCTSTPAPLTENVEVHSSHLGYGHQLETLLVIADRLALPEGQWRPFDTTALASLRRRWR